ncbi:MAG: DinB family protein [Vicinamibacterales bacterium]
MTPETPQQYTARILAFADDQDPRTVLSSTADRLRAFIEGRSRDELMRQPEPSRWSVAQIMAHLADAEVVAAWRLRSIIAHDGIALQPFDQNAWEAAFNYAEVEATDSLRLFEENRRANLSLLRRIDPRLHANHGMHAERGRETITHLLRLYAGHDLNHLSQVERLVAITGRNG